MKLHVTYQKLIQARQMTHWLTPTYPLVELASVYVMCPEIPGHPIKLYLVSRQHIRNLIRKKKFRDGIHLLFVCW